MITVIDYSFFNFSDAHLTSKNILYTFVCILQYYIQSVPAHESKSGIICFVFLSLIEEKKIMLQCTYIYLWPWCIWFLFNQGHFTSIFWHEFMLYSSFSLTVMSITQCLYYFLQELECYYKVLYTSIWSY